MAWLDDEDRWVKIGSVRRRQSSLSRCSRKKGVEVVASVEREFKAAYVMQVLNVTVHHSSGTSSPLKPETMSATMMLSLRMMRSFCSSDMYMWVIIHITTY